MGEDFLYISIEPRNDKKLRKSGRGIPKYSAKSIEKEDLGNMLTDVISVSKVKLDNIEKTYFLIDLTTNYYSQVVSEMLSELNLELKTVLNENKILVKGDVEFLQKVANQEKILKKITKPIHKIYPLDINQKLGQSLIQLVSNENKKDEIVPISIKFIDNLNESEEEEFKNVLFKITENEVYINYLKNSKQFICSSSSKKILEVAELPFVKKINKISEIAPQSTMEKQVAYGNEDYQIIPYDNAPIVCALDSGISEKFEKYCLFLDNYEYDNPYDENGHGTSVSSLILFGEDLLKKSKLMKQKTRIISFKIDSNGSEPVIPLEEAIMVAIERYHAHTSIFSLSYNYHDGLNGPELEDRIDIARKLDRFIQKYNVILINSGGNIISEDAYMYKDEFPKYLSYFPVLSPADCRNIFSVGAICKNSTLNKCYMSYMTRMGISPIYIKEDLDKYRFFKPEIYTFGGNKDLGDAGSPTDLEMPCSNLGIPVIDLEGNICFAHGTSFATPLISLSFTHLFEKYKDVIKNSETYRAIILNKCQMKTVNELPVFYLLDCENITNCFDGIYINFEGELVPRYRSEDIEKTNIFECKSIEFYMPSEAKSIDVVSVHSNDYVFQNPQSYNTRIVLEIKKANRVSIKKTFGTINRYCPNSFAHYTFSKDYEGVWTINVHVETRSIPKEFLNKVRIRFGISIRINLKELNMENLRQAYDKIVNSTPYIKNKESLKIKQKRLDEYFELEKDLNKESIHEIVA